MSSWLLAVSGGVYLAAVAVFGRHLVFNDVRRRSRPQLSELRGFAVDSVNFRSHDDLRLRGWYVHGQAEGTHKGLVIMLHGWHRDRSRIIEHIRFIAEAGFDVFAYDQRGHGASETGLITFGPLEGKDMLCAVDFLVAEYDLQPGTTAALGFSLGSAAIIHALSETPRRFCTCVILEGVSSTSRAVGRYMLETKYGRPLGAVMAYAVFTVGSALASLGRFKHSRSINKVHALASIPKLFIRGGQDHMVSEDDAMRLIRAAPEPREVWINPSGGHTNSLSVAPDDYTKRVLDFLDCHLLHEPSRTE